MTIGRLRVLKERFEVRSYSNDWYEVVCRIVDGGIVEAALRMRGTDSVWMGPVRSVWAPGINHWVAEGYRATIDTGNGMETENGKRSRAADARERSRED